MGTDARKQFDRTAANYAVSRAHSNSRSLALLKEFAGDRRYRIAIDIATGPGFAAFALADQCDEMIATDISAGMLQQVQKLSAERKIDNVERSLADAHALPFRDASLDLIACRTAPHHFASIPTFLSEVRRVLASSGVFLMVDTTTSESELPRIWHQSMEWRRDRSHVAAPSPSGWRREFIRAGFRVVGEQLTTVDMEFNDWVLRSNTPQEEVQAMRNEWKNIDEKISAEYSVKDCGNGDYSFRWPVIVLKGVIS